MRTPAKHSERLELCILCQAFRPEAGALPQDVGKCAAMCYPLFRQKASWAMQMGNGLVAQARKDRQG